MCQTDTNAGPTKQSVWAFLYIMEVALPCLDMQVGHGNFQRSLGASYVQRLQCKGGIGSVTWSNTFIIGSCITEFLYNTNSNWNGSA